MKREKKIRSKCIRKRNKRKKKKWKSEQEGTKIKQNGKKREREIVD